MRASREGDLDTIETLIKAGVDVNAKDKNPFGNVKRVVRTTRPSPAIRLSHSRAPFTVTPTDHVLSHLRKAQRPSSGPARLGKPRRLRSSPRRALM